MTENVTSTGYMVDFGRSAAHLRPAVSDAAKAVAKKAVKKAVKKAEKKQYDFYVLIAVAAVGLAVFFAVGIIAAAARGFNGGIGGEVVFSGCASAALYFLWKKLRGHIKD